MQKIGVRAIDPAEVESLLATMKIRVSTFTGEAWIPLRERLRGADQTLGNRVQERSFEVHGVALYGSPSAADLMTALTDAGYCVLSVSATAYQNIDPMLSLQGTEDGWRRVVCGFHGVTYGMIDARVTIVLAEFREKPGEEDPC